MLCRLIGGRAPTCVKHKETCVKKGRHAQLEIYGAQNEAYRMTEGRKMGEVVSLQTVRRSLMVEAPQNETFT